MSLRKIELLSPAANKEIAIEAIKHGADAIYIGPPSHGARKSASNSIRDIEEVVDFAHQFRAKVYATVNTIIYDNEIKSVETLIRDLYHIGVDALIVQDMGVLRMKIPPISLHASTQCDIRTPEKAKFLEEVGFSQLVLARELTLKEIEEIVSVVSIPVETFIHGALCVCYSGRCQASYSINGRSANRGECAQICRYPFTLTDKDSNLICKDKYLLSLKDLNASQNLEDLLKIGVRSFKIEGRLKDIGYVKNITSYYSRILNQFISNNSEKYERNSYGEVTLTFEPNVEKSFNRGFTNYFLEGRNPLWIASMATPKSQGEKIKKIGDLNNGDGISFYDKNGKFTGVNINRIEGNRIIPSRNIEIPKTIQIYRTSDIKWDKIINSSTAERKIKTRIEINDNFIEISDERGVKATKPMNLSYSQSKKPMDYENIFKKLGNSPYVLKEYINNLDTNKFYRASEITSLRRNLVELLNEANKITYPFEYRKRENYNAQYPFSTLDYRDNVANRLAEIFYKEHGVTKIEKAIEVNNSEKKGKTVMTTRHCVLRELGMCKKKQGQSLNRRLPLYLHYKGGKFRLDFDCEKCEMNVIL